MIYGVVAALSIAQRKRVKIASVVNTMNTIVRLSLPKVVLIEFF
jgi:beta-phosphoglucomutase-like phosphatase (HAD superfamily)